MIITLLLIIALCTNVEKAKNREIINNLNNKRNTTSLLSTSMSTSTAASQVKKVQHRKHQLSVLLHDTEQYK